MVSDKILMIPLLSKELTLIGHSPLPFKIKTLKRSKVGNQTDENSFKVVFDTKILIEAFTSVCLDLVKQIKLFGEKDDEALDKINFKNAKLEKQLSLCKLEIERTEKALAAEKESNQQLKEKICNLEQHIKNLEIDKKKLVQRNETTEDMLKHSLKKKDSELIDLHKTLWKKFNMVDKNFLPSNFTIVQTDQPDFSKLWSEVKYSNIETRETLLKKAVSLFQKNNKILMEDNIIFKTFILSFLQNTIEVQKLMCQKMHVPNEVLVYYKMDDLCPDVESLNFHLCKSILYEHLNLLKKLCVKFQEAAFSVGDEIFVCWSDVICKLPDI